MRHLIGHLPRCQVAYAGINRNSYCYSIDAWIR